MSHSAGKCQRWDLNQSCLIRKVRITQPVSQASLKVPPTVSEMSLDGTEELLFLLLGICLTHLF